MLSKLSKSETFNLRVTPKSSRTKVVLIKPGDLKVYLTKPAYDGLANEQLIELLANYFKVKKYQVKIIKGLKGRDKVAEITSAG